MKARKRIEFECPKCGKCYFNSTARTGDGLAGKLDRYCNSTTHGSRCNFEFPEEDDWKYFKMTVTCSFDSSEEYGQALSRKS